MPSSAADTESELTQVEDIVGPRFELKKRLGAGATSMVYEALDRSCNRKVALKVMRPVILSVAEVRTRFAHEVRAVAAIDHPNIVRLYDANMHDGVLVLELVTGGSLQERLARGPVPVAEAVDIGRQIALALVAAHAAGVIHRDLKPANVLLGRNDDGAWIVKVGDFGVAHVGDSALTETGARIGTPAYMAPEQLRSSRQADARADIYAAGLVLFELLTGERFHVGDEVPRNPRADVERACHDVDLAAIVARCLEEQREKRFADAKELATALERVGRPKLAREAETQPAQRRRSPLGLVTLVGVVGLLGAAWVAAGRHAEGTTPSATSDTAHAHASASSEAAASSSSKASASSSGELALPTPLGAHGASQAELRQAIAHLYGLDMTGADATLDALVTAEPTNADASYYLSWTRAFGSGRSDKALEAIHAALRNPQPPNRRAVLDAMEAYERHAWDEMLRNVRPAATASPGDWELAHALGEAYSHSGAVDEGLATFDRIQSLSPRFLLPWSHVMEMALARGNRDIAERWTRALRDTPDAHSIGIAWTMHWRISQGDAEGALAVADASPNAAMPRAHLWNSDPIAEARTGALALLGRWDDARRVSIEASGNLRADPDAQTLAWIAYAQGRQDEWKRWMATARGAAESGRLERADLVHAEQSMAYAMAGDVAEAHAALGRALTAGHGEPSRSPAFAALILAWLDHRESELPAPISGTPELALATRGVREALAGRDADARADLEKALATAAWAYSDVPIAWLGAVMSRGHDDAARDRFCDFIRRPRHFFWHWAYARQVCP